MKKKKYNSTEEILAVKKRGNKVVKVVRHKDGKVYVYIEERAGRYHGHNEYSIGDRKELAEYKKNILKNL